MGQKERIFDVGVDGLFGRDAGVCLPACDAGCDWAASLLWKHGAGLRSSRNGSEWLMLQG
jgi:hypothetical protein